MLSPFDRIIPRRGSGCSKWDSDQDEAMLPMWVADMDFATAPAIVEALQRRVSHGIFGYAKIPPGYYRAVVDWFARRHRVELQPDWILPATGVVPAISAVIRALTTAGDGVLVLSPVYNCFHSSIRNMQCRLIESELVLEGGRYAIDFDDLEARLVDPSCKLLLLCNPHNPVGRAWSRDELKRIGALCLAHEVTVVSDEIHCDLVMPGFRHVPYASLGPEYALRSVSFVSPSKAFNLAGLQVANILAADPRIRERVDRALNIHEVGEIGPLAVEAQIAAYTQGGPWLDALLPYLHTNYLYLRDFLGRHAPRLEISPLEATYLVWIDCRKLGMSSARIAELALGAHLRINPGTLYGRAGEGFIRINIACPRAQLEEGLRRLVQALGQAASEACR